MADTKTLTTRLDLRASWNYQKQDEIATTKEVLEFKHQIDLESGSGNSANNIIFRDRRRVTLSTTTDDIDLNSLTDRFGDSISFASIKMLLIRNRSTTSGENLLIGGAGSGNNAWHAPWDGDQDAKSPCRASGDFLIADPLGGLLVSGTSKVLRVAHAGVAGDIDYDIIIYGVD